MRKHIKALLLCALVLTVLTGISLASAEEGHTHEYVTITAPSCETPGLMRCEGCGTEVVIPAIGHIAGSTKESVTLPATCTASGIKVIDVLCSHCGKTISSSTESIPAMGHDYSGSYAVITPATCTSAGIQGLKCTRCGEVLHSSSIPALGHQYGDPVIVTPATCTAPGVRTRTCLRGDDILTETIPATGHTFGGWTIVQAPTCTAPGMQTRTCSKCNLTESQNLPAKGHTFGPWAIVTPATCTSGGTQTRTCTVCGYTETMNTPPTGHIWSDWSYTTMATCTTPGKATQYCTQCGETNSRTIPAYGHSWSSWVTVLAPTCDHSGTQERTCPLCGKVESRVSPALGHNWSQWEVTIPATSTSTGLLQRTCANCHQVETQIIPKIGLKDTLCAFGLRLKDVGNYLNPSYSAWYMFTPFDASIEGMQTYELVVNDAYIVGTCTLSVLNGEVSFSYTLNNPGVQIQEEFFTIVNKMTDLTKYEPEELMDKYALKTNTPYSISQQFGGDTNLVLYMCCRVRFEYDASMNDLNYNSAYHQGLVKQMTSILD